MAYVATLDKHVPDLILTECLIHSLNTFLFSCPKINPICLPFAQSVTLKSTDPVILLYHCIVCCPMKISRNN